MDKGIDSPVEQFVPVLPDEAPCEHPAGSVGSDVANYGHRVALADLIGVQRHVQVPGIKGGGSILN